jgi:formylglycine-generating enzyme required for sulfatase activity
MYGNVYEWVQDTYHLDYISAPSYGSAWASGGDSHVARGSSFNRQDFPNSPATAGCRSANRGGGTDTKLDDKGFRLLMEI